MKQEEAQTARDEAVFDALRRFPAASHRSLARFLCARHKGMFPDFNNARQAVRYQRGARIGGHGKKKKPFLYKPYEIMPISQRIKRESFMLPKGRWGILPDLHVPFHEEKPFETAIEWFRDSKITGLIFAGDFQDVEALSYWKATRRRDFVDEVEATCDMLDTIRGIFPTQKIIWQQGNHEERLASYYRAFAPELADLPTSDMETILALNKRKITLLEPKQKIELHAFTLLHGHEMRGSYSPVSPARWAFLKMKACGAIGHFHATSECTKQSINRQLISTWSFGCLCDLEPDYNPYGNDWNWGCARIDYDGYDWEIRNRRILPTGRLD